MMTSQVYPRLRGERQLFPEIPRRVEHRANDAGANGEVAEAFTGLALSVTFRAKAPVLAEMTAFLRQHAGRRTLARFDIR